VTSNIKAETQTEGVRKQGAEKIFGSKKDEVTGGWRKLHNEELRNLYSSPSIIRTSNQGGCDGRGM
jgi:hypothetical protein